MRPPRAVESSESVASAVLPAGVRLEARVAMIGSVGSFPDKDLLRARRA